jgi:hypothetical protein
VVHCEKGRSNQRNVVGPAEHGDPAWRRTPSGGCTRHESLYMAHREPPRSWKRPRASTTWW